MRELPGQQGSDMWLRHRQGRITCSRLTDVMAKLKRSDGEAAARRNYRTELVGERLCNRSEGHYVSRDMEEGTEREPFARMLYQAEAQTMVIEAGFVLHPTMDFFGGSPDGLCGNHGGLEIKCPKQSTHVGYLRGGVVPEEYEPQVMGNILCCEREWWDFVSFCPFMPDALKLFKVRVYRDEKRIREIEEEVLKLHEEVEIEIASLGQPPTVWMPYEEAVKSQPPEEDEPTEPMTDDQYRDSLMAVVAGEIIP